MRLTRPAFRHATALALLLAACGTLYDDKDFQGRTRLMVETGLTDIQDIYIEPVDLDAPGEAALDGLNAIDPGIEVRHQGRELQLVLDGRSIGAARIPNEPTPSGWSAVTADLAVKARNASNALRSGSEESIYEAMFNGVTERLDRFSRYASAEDARDNRAVREGFGGIGITIEAHPEGILVTAITPDMPAAGAGVHPGDLIVAIEGEAIAGYGLRKIVRMLRGPVDEPVLVRIAREGMPDPFDIIVGRTEIVPNTVTYERLGRLAYIRISAFNERTAKLVAEAVGQARTDIGADLGGLILDLRDNAGGLLDQAVDVADLFLSDGLIVSTRGRHPESIQYFEAERGDIVGGEPIVVLINGASASAAEIVAAALQDQDRAVLVGTNSFGKGTVQNVLRMPNEGELILTWARFHAPSGYPLDDVGVLPTVCTSGRDNADAVLEHGLYDAYLSAQIDTQARRAVRSNDDRRTEVARERCPWDPTQVGDVDRAGGVTARPAVPRPAASLVLLRGASSAAQVVIGRRSATMRFMPGRYVFPGGAQEAGDASLAWTALRETREETGLTVAGIDCLRPIARAVTPAISPIRFDTVFYLAGDDAVTGAPVSGGELEAVGWHDVDEALAGYPLADITHAVLTEAVAMLERGFDPEETPERIRFFSYDGIRINAAWEDWVAR